LVLLVVCSSFLPAQNANANVCHESPKQKIHYQQTIMPAIRLAKNDHLPIIQI
jgi:hypothetical protein